MVVDLVGREAGLAVGVDKAGGVGILVVCGRVPGREGCAVYACGGLEGEALLLVGEGEREREVGTEGFDGLGTLHDSLGGALETVPLGVAGWRDVAHEPEVELAGAEVGLKRLGIGLAQLVAGCARCRVLDERPRSV